MDNVTVKRIIEFPIWVKADDANDSTDMPAPTRLELSASLRDLDSWIFQLARLSANGVKVNVHSVRLAVDLAAQIRQARENLDKEILDDAAKSHV